MSDLPGNATKRLQWELYDMETAPFTLNVRMVEADVMETLLYGCAMWTLGKEHFAELRTAHDRFPLRVIGSSADNAQTTSRRTPRPSRR